MAVLLLPFAGGQVLALGTLDQEVLPSGLWISQALTAMSQTFTAGLTGTLDSVALYGRQQIGSSWTVAIKAVDGLGAPTGVDLATGSAAAPATVGWTQIALTPATPVTAGTMYAIIVEVPTPAWNYSALPYAGGVGTSLNGSADFAFRTYVTVAAPPAPEAPIIALAVGNAVATAQDGAYGPSVTVSAGSTVWRKVGVVNNSNTGLNGLTFADSGGALPASCPALPSVLASGAAWSCSFSQAAVAGTATYTATATFGLLTATATATVTGTGAQAFAGAASKLGLPSSSWPYTTATKAVLLHGYVTWQAGLGSAAAGKTVGVYLSSRGSDGSWGPWTRVTGRRADASGTVVYSRREAAAAWLSVRFSLDGVTFMNALQARWR